MTIRTTILAMILAAATATVASAQDDWPNKPIRMITGGGNGSSSDIIGRTFGEYFRKQTGQNWVMDNRPGASSRISVGVAQQADPDGYTFYLTQVAAMAVAPNMMKEPDYDPRTAFAPVAKLTTAANVFFVRSDDDRFNSLQDIIDLAKKDPGALSYAVASPGTTSNMSIALLRHRMNLDMVMVPYKSSAEPVLSVLRGDTDFSAAGIAVVVGHVGQVKPLAVSTSTRQPQLPDVPTVAELGVPDYDVSSWFGMVAPLGTPQVYIDKMAAILKDAMDDPQVKEQILKSGLAEDYREGEAFKTFIDAEFDKWKAIVDASGVPKQ